MGAGNTYLIKDLFTELITTTNEMMAQVEKFTQPLDHYNTTLKFTPPRWLDRDIWQAYGVKFANYTTMLPTFDLNNAEG